MPLLELDPELALPDGTRLSEALERLEGERVEPGRDAQAAAVARSGSSQAAGRIGGASPG